MSWKRPAAFNLKFVYIRGKGRWELNHTEGKTLLSPEEVAEPADIAGSLTDETFAVLGQG